MFTNKKNLIKLTAGIGLSAAMLLTGSVSGQAFQSQIVEASSSYKVRLKHNAYVYNHKGKKARKAPLKKGKTLKVYKSNKIKGKKYLYLGKNQYVKAGNATTLKHKKGLFEATITSGGQIFRAPNQEPTDYYALLQVNVLEEHADSNGTIWYRIGKDRWIISTDTNKPKGSVPPAEKTTDNQETSTSTETEANNSVQA